MIDDNPPEEVRRAVEYLQDSDDPVDSRVSVIKNATETGEFTIEDVLSTYANSLSINGAIHPMDESQLRELHAGIQREFGDDTVDSLSEVCQPNKLIRTKEDVITQCINIYTGDEESKTKRQRQIKSLIQDAQRDGIDISHDSVIRSLKDFHSSTSGRDAGSVSVDMESTSLAEGIEIPDAVQAQEEYVYRALVDDGTDVTDIDWYIGGTHAGSGEKVAHTFEFPGVYTISIELTDSNGKTDNVSEEVSVSDSSTINISITGDTVVDAGETAHYQADITTLNETVQEIEWVLDGDPAGTGKILNATFDEESEHTLSVTATGQSGLTATDTKSISVETPTSISVTVEGENMVYVGDTVTFDCEIEAENSYIDSTTCKVGNELIPVDESSELNFENTFEEPGEYPVTVTSSNNAGNTDTGVATVNVHIPPEVSITEAPEEIIRGDGATFKADFNEELSSSWSVNNASLTHVGERTAQVNFSSETTDKASVTVEVENGAGETATETKTIDVYEPRVEAVVTGASEATIGDNVEFSAEQTAVEHAEIERIEWALSDGQVIGHGEVVTYAFSSPGEYTVSATVHTDRNVGDTVTTDITVNPETDATAVILDRGGPTTRDTFTLDARKSRGKNTEIQSYTWDIDEQDEITGSVVEVDFDSPGSYNVELTIVAESGDVDTDRTTLSVEQYTNVTAAIAGPDETGIGDQAQFTAQASEPVNTSITDYTWTLNGKPAGSGEEFTQTFGQPGHYTIEVEISTATGDTDTASKNILIETPPAEIDPEITFDEGPPFRVSDNVALSGEDTEVIYGEISRFEWTIDGEDLADTASKVDTLFPAYGMNTVDLTVYDVGGVTETISEEVYVSPHPAKPPYTELTEESAVADVYSESVDIYKNETLQEDDRNRSAAHLIHDAHDLDIDVSVEDVEEYLSDIDAIDDDTVSIDLESVSDERDDRHKEINVELVTEDEEDGKEEGDEEEWDVSSSDESDDGDDFNATDDAGFDLEEEDTSIEDENDEDMWKIETGDTSTPGSEDTFFGHDTAEFGVKGGKGETEEEGEKRSDAKTDRSRSSQFDTDEDLPSVDDNDIDDRHKEARVTPESYDLGGSVLAMPNYTQDLVDFEYIMGENDELVPEGVNGAGIVAAEDDQYIAIGRVTGRDWSIHTMDKKQDIVKTYESQFLAGLDNPVQIVSIPTRFDLQEHIELVDDVLSDNTDKPEELLMNIGRSIYPNWLEDFMTQNDMKERQFYIIVSLSAEQLHEFKGGTKNITEKLADMPGIGGMFDRFVEETADDISKYQCLRELNTRVKRIQNNLRRMEVQVERVDNRDEAMSVLYHYYHNEEPDRGVFPTGPFTSTDSDPTVGGVSVSDLIEGHQPAHDGVEGKEGGSQ